VGQEKTRDSCGVANNCIKTMQDSSIFSSRFFNSFNLRYRELLSRAYSAFSYSDHADCTCVTVERTGLLLQKNRREKASKSVVYYCNTSVCVFVSIKFILHFKTDDLLFWKCFINYSRFLNF